MKIPYYVVLYNVMRQVMASRGPEGSRTEGSAAGFTSHMFLSVAQASSSDPWRATSNRDGLHEVCILKSSGYYGICIQSSEYYGICIQSSE